MEIPVVNISSSNQNAPAQLLEAAATCGFVFIENSEDVGVPPADISRMFALSKQFFASPTEVKEEVSISSNKAGKNHGWLRRGIEMLDPATQKRADVKEALNIGEHINGSLQQDMPKPLQEYVQTIIDFQDRCHEFCLRIFENLANALDIDENWFEERHDRRKGLSGTVLRMLYYPKVLDIEDGVDIRAGAHSDFGSVTLLFQLPGQPGLEIQSQSGDWIPVPVDPHANSITNREKLNAEELPVLVNIGDLLEDWTGGLLKSTVHRVVFPIGEANDRYSIAYFLQPLDDARLDPVPSRLVEDHMKTTGKTTTRNGKVLTSKDHLMERLAATYNLK